MQTMLSTACNSAPRPAEARDTLPPGAKAGPWIVERELGRGGMGAVYAVVHDEIGKRAALKVLHAHLLSSVNPDRVVLEARVVNQVEHPNIVDIFETGKLPDGRPYIVMERLEGRPLAHLADEGRLRAELVITILLEVCDVLIAAHAAGIVHRDLKLDNVFLADNPADPSAPRVKLLDWGIAKVLHTDVRHTIEGQLVGTPQYLAPEQARGAEVSPKADVYSLGVMAYELFLEQLPFEAETSAEIMTMHLRALPPPPHEIWPEIPPALEALLLEMLAKPPEQRPEIREVARRLEAIRNALLGDRLEAPPITRSIARPIARPSSAPPVRIGSAPPARIGSAPRAAGSGSGPRGAASGSGPRGAGSGSGPRRGEPDDGESPALAPTALGGPIDAPAGGKRWQFALGALAIAAGAVLFIASRGGDRDAAASPAPPMQRATAVLAHGSTAAVPAPSAASTAIAALAAIAAPAMPVAARAPAPTEPHAAAATVEAAELLREGRTTARSAKPARPPRSTRLGGGGAGSPRPNLAPAGPRRGKLDPDGTVDAYR